MPDLKRTIKKVIAVYSKYKATGSCIHAAVVLTELLKRQGCNCYFDYGYSLKPGKKACVHAWVHLEGVGKIDIGKGIHCHIWNIPLFKAELVKEIPEDCELYGDLKPDIFNHLEWIKNGHSREYLERQPLGLKLITDELGLNV